jgi:hypothetical protein
VSAGKLDCKAVPFSSKTDLLIVTVCGHEFQLLPTEAARLRDAISRELASCKQQLSGVAEQK